MKKIVCGLLLCSMFLAGCNNKKEDNKVSKTVASTTVVGKPSSSKASKASSADTKNSAASTEKISENGNSAATSNSAETPSSSAATNNDPIAAAKKENLDAWTEAVTYASKVTGVENNEAEALPIYDSIRDNGVPFTNDHWPTSVNYSSDLGRVAAIGSPMYDLNMGTNFSGKNPDGEFASATDVKVTTAGSYQVAPTTDAAIGILAQQNGNNPDYIYTDMGEGADGKGSYREIKITSQSAQAQGEAGTIARTKVYGDGSTADAY